MTPPKNETIWVQFIKDGVPVYAITSTALRDMYYLCEIKGDKLVKTKHKSANPKDLEKYVWR